MKKLNSLISVIVPVYKVEKYINRCVESIINQSYTNLEIILIDDGSPDSCGQICDQYAEKDSRIKVVHQDNSGLSGARNTGIDMAQGEYIGFVDSDDYIHPRMYELLYEGIKRHKAELVICGFKYVVSEGYDIEELHDISTLKTVLVEKLIDDIYKHKGKKTVVAWNKLYNKRLFENYRYPVGKVHEDEFAVHHLLGMISFAVQLNEELYYYYQRSDSIVGQGYSVKTLDRLSAYEDRLRYYKSKGLRQPYIQAFTHYMCHLSANYVALEKYRPNDVENRKSVREKFINGYGEFDCLVREAKKNKMKLFHKYRRIIKVKYYMLIIKYRKI